MCASKVILIGWVVVLIAGWVGWGVAATDRYVSLVGTNDVAGGFTNWSGAATNIKAAVDRANTNNAGDTVWVASGIYNVPITIIISNSVVRGFSGNPADIVVDGGGVTQCFVLSHTNAMLADMTVSNGRNHLAATTLRRGGAVTVLTGQVVNAVIGWSRASTAGGGVLLSGAVDGALIERCLIIGNYCVSYGGGASIYYGCGTILDTTVVSNWITSSSGRGGGIGLYNVTNAAVIGCLVRENTSAMHGGGISYGGTTGLIANCIIEHNIANADGLSYGGGLYIDEDHCLIRNSIIGGNSSANYAGGIALRYGTMQSCLIASNLANSFAGGFYNRYAPVVQNCTIVANTAGRGGGTYTANELTATFVNCIVYNNLRTNSGLHDIDGLDGITNRYFNSCSARLLAPNQGNITNAPLWVDFSGGDYRQQQTSLCVNTGTNLAGMAEMTDLDGKTRIDRFSGKVDMGCYEYIPEGMLFKAK